MPEGDQIDIARGVARDLQSTITEQREVQETAEDSDGKMGSAPTEPIVRNEYGEITNPSSTRHADDYERDASEAARLYAEHQQSTKPTRVPPLSPAPAHENAPRPSATLTEAQVAQRDLYRIQVREAKNAFFAPIADKNVPGISEEEHAHLKALETDFRRKYPDRAFDLLPQQEQNTAHMRALRRRLRVFLRDVGLADPKNLPTIVLARIPEQAKAFDGRALVDANVILLRAGEARADMETLELVIHEAAHLRQVPRIREMAQTPGGEAHLDDLYDELMQGFRENPDIRWLLSKHPFDRPHRDSELLLVESFAQAAIYFTLGHKNSIAWLPAFHDWQQGLLYDYPEATTAAQDLRDTTGDKKAVLADAAGARGTVSVSARGPVRQKSGASGATGEVEARRLTPALPKVDAWLADPATQGTRLARLSEAELRELAADVIASAPTGKGAALLAKIRDYQQAHEAARKLAATSATTWARQLAQLSAPALRQLQRVLANPSSAEELDAALQAELADLDAQTQHVRGITTASQAKVVALEGRLDALQEQRRQHKREELTRREAERNALVASGKRRGAPTDAEQSRLDDLTTEIAALNTERRGFKQAEVAELTARIKRAKAAAARAADHRNVLLKLLENNRRATRKNFAAARQETEARRANQRRFVAEEIDIRASVGAFDTAASAQQQAPNAKPAFTDAQVAALKSMFEGGWPRLGASLAGRSPKALESLVRGMNRVVAATDEQLAAVLPEGWSLAKLRALAKGWGRSIELAIAKRNDPNAAKPAPDAAAAADAAWREEFKTERAEVTADTRPLNIWHGSGENAKLSNLSLRPFSLGGRKFFSVEQAIPGIVAIRRLVIQFSGVLPAARRRGLPFLCQTLEMIAYGLLLFRGRGILATPRQQFNGPCHVHFLRIETIGNIVFEQRGVRGMSGDNHQRGMQGAQPCLIGMGRHAGRFHETIEGVVIGAEIFIVRQAACLVPVIIDEDDARHIAAPHAAAGRMYSAVVSGCPTTSSREALIKRSSWRGA